MSGFLAWMAGSGIVQGVIIGLTFAYLTTIIILSAVAKAETRTVNGWSAIPKAGRPGNGLLVRAALQKALPAVNVFEEAAYWTATSDEAGSRLAANMPIVFTSRQISFPRMGPSGHSPRRTPSAT